MALHIFVDESIRRAFLLCAVMVDSGSLDKVRRQLRELLQHGQRKLHFVNERPARRRSLLSSMVSMGFQARAYVSAKRPVPARRDCLRELLLDLADQPVDRLVIESGDAENARDRQVIYEHTEKIPWLRDGTYDHLRPYEEPILWAADAIAWAIGAGGHWSASVASVVDKVIEIDT